MTSKVIHKEENVSPYLLRPIRTIEQALADIEKARKADKREGR